MEYITLNDGNKMPVVGLGTFLMKPEDAEEAVYNALMAGYRLIDTANGYMNERAVGRGIKRSGLKREEVFIETKLWPTVYTKETAVDETLERLGVDYIDLLLLHQPAGDYITGYKMMEKAVKEGKSILYEAQLGALRDVDYGIYPYVTSSNTIAAYAPVGAGIPGVAAEKVIGVVKAYSTCVGEGPFVAEWFGEEAEELRKAGGEYGAKTGRPRRVGPIDIPATRYGVQCQNATDIALTKLDVLSYMKDIPICARYELNGEETDDSVFPTLLQDCKPVLKTMPGWQCDISACRRWEDLPKEAQDYVLYIEEAIGCHITYVSVGAERDAYIKR